MKHAIVFLLLIAVCLSVHATAAIDFSSWKEVEIDDSITNNSSTTVYTVMVPPDTTYFSNDTPSGPATIFVNQSDPSLVYAIYIFDNPFGKKLTTDTATSFLHDFMTGADIVPSNESKPIELSDGIVEYGSMGEKAAGVYVLSTDEKVTILSGLYATMDDAMAGIEKLAMVAGTVKTTPIEKA